MMAQITWLKKLNDEDASFLNTFEKELVEEFYLAIEEEVQLTFPDEDDDGDVENLPDKLAIIEENLKLIIRRLRMSKEIQNRFMKEYPKWEEVRSKNAKSLEAIGVYTHDIRKNYNIPRLIGNCITLVGGGICFATIVLTHLTAGLTAPLAIVGGSISVLGSLTSIGASITEMTKLNTKIQEAKLILEQDKESIVALKLWLSHANDLSEALYKILAVDGGHRIEGLFKILRDFVELILSSQDRIERKKMLKSLVKSTISIIPREMMHKTLTTNLVSLLLIIAILYNRNQKYLENASLKLKVIDNTVTFMDFAVDVLQSASNFIKREITFAIRVCKIVTAAAVAGLGIIVVIIIILVNWNKVG